MDQSNTLCSTREAATRSVEAMTRPEGMTRVTWAWVQVVLRAIARCYPTAYPSQLTLAARLDIPERSLRRYIAAAVEAHLLVVEADAGVTRKGWSRTNRYRLVDVRCEATLASEKATDSYGVCSGTPSQETSSPGTSLARPPASQLPSPHPTPAGSTVVSMQQWDDERSRQLAPTSPRQLSKRPPKREGDADALVSSLDSRRRQRRRQPQPKPAWYRLGDYFCVLWQQMQQTTGRYKDVRPLESVGQVKPYILKHFADRSELEVRKMMEEFVTAVSKRDITIKPGQSAWLCFTGAWGRQRHVVVADRYAAYRKG